MNQKKFYFISAGIIILAIIAYFLIFKNDKTQQIYAKVKKGMFQIEVTTTGELIAKRSDKIYGPLGLRQLGISNVKIQNIIPDGTVVDSGEYVATLDPTEILNRIKEEETNFDKFKQNLLTTKLDTSGELSNARDELINLKYYIEEKKLALDQSLYETAETKRKVQMELEKAVRDLNQAQKNYNLKLQKNKANMNVVSGQYFQAKRKLDQLINLQSQFTITAPKAGMVIYHTNPWENTKMGIGSNMNTWENIVAEFPDLTKMISRTYVNEIDINKVKVGQDVKINVDAFPQKQFTGKVVSAANMGEQSQNSNAKVFEVQIFINESDTVLLPGMTTKNSILTARIDNVIFVPVESIFGNDSLSFVYKKDGARILKQQVIVGQSNENEIIIKAGLKENDQLLLVPPAKSDDLKLLTLSFQEIEKYKEKPSTSNKPVKQQIDSKVLHQKVISSQPLTKKKTANKN